MSNPQTQHKFEPTPRQVMGPYFLSNSPKRSYLIPDGMRGDIMKIAGQVVSTTGQLIKGATIHIWLADPKGVYDNQDAKGNPIDLPPEKHKLRGRVVTDDHAAWYLFQFLRPGNYPLEGEAVDTRPAHVHILIEAPGYSELITQLYFMDDPFNTHDIPRDGFFQPELAIHFDPVIGNGYGAQNGRFNFVLRKLQNKASWGKKHPTATSLESVVESFADAVSSHKKGYNQKLVNKAFESAAYHTVGIERFIMLVNKELAKRGDKHRIARKAMDTKTRNVKTGHWRFHNLELAILRRLAHETGEEFVEKDSWSAKFSVFEAL